MNTKDKILEFFNDKGMSGIEYDTDLFAGGYVNSLFAIEIVMYIEDEFDVKIKNKDITEKNFKTVTKIAETIEKYL